MTAPSAGLLSNGRYRVILSEAGGGYSAWRDLALTRWAGDPLTDSDGYFIFLQDLDGGEPWSAGLEPLAREPARYESRWEPGLVDIVRDDEGVTTRLEVAVAPDADLEYRRITLVNSGAATRRLQVTSYVEVVLNAAAADAAHPAFSKLFVQTESLRRPPALLAHRRPRSRDEPTYWMGHSLALETGDGKAAVRWETDRARFIGRGRSLAAPAALQRDVELTGTVGNVLDPILSVRRHVELGPGAEIRLSALLAAGESREEVASLLTRRQISRASAVFREARAREQNIIASLDLPESWVARVPALTGALLYGASRSHQRGAPTLGNGAAVADLRRLGLSGGNQLLLVLAVLRTPDEVRDVIALAGLVRWWRQAGLEVDLLVAEEGASVGSHLAERAGSVEPSRGTTVVVPASAIDPDLLLLADRCARFTLENTGVQVPAAIRVPRRHPTPFRPAVESDSSPMLLAAEETEESLLFFNGHGGFTQDGTEYVIRLGWEAGGARGRDGGLRLPPLPWVNVVTNELTGFVTTERGAGYTWCLNSRENRLTPWSNDPVVDPFSEALFLRDEERAIYWSPLPGPTPAPSGYEVRHGFGYTSWRHSSFELDQEVLAFVPRHDPVKLTRIRIVNRGAETRRLSLFTYAEWVLGANRADTARLIVTERDGSPGALFATNRHRPDLAGRVAFAAVVPPAGAGPLEATGDRSGFLGLAGSTRRPGAVLQAEPLDGRTGCGLDPCAAFRIPFELPPGATAEATLLLGEAEDRAAAVELIRRYSHPDQVAEALAEVKAFWRNLVSGVEAHTPLPALDLLVNGWLTYQNLACRMWARSAFYQSGGAYGFRDQLQDAAALMHLVPDLTRKQILLHAGHQFREGDVLHWWHPPRSVGIRTRFSDDLLWLPYVVSEYIRHTGEESLLDQLAPFLEGPLLAPGEDEALLTPERAADTSDLYDHCCRALDRSLTRGSHGLPLIGTGDWNDGMNRVGREGRGESVWLGFFLFAILDAFLPTCERRGDHERAARYREYRNDLADALNDAGWDGKWYRRAFYDDGALIGSAASDECRIDAIAQAWAVLSGVAPPEKATLALDAAEGQLVDERVGIIRLLTPPFDRTRHDPGYIRGYLPGVRENGGQYTHGALWLVRALAESGRTERVAPLLEMLSPITRGATRSGNWNYRAEPYVVAADVYGEPPHLGRGGWTWYTGSAGWMFRVVLESLLGVTVERGIQLALRPCIPAAWPGFTLRYRLPGDGAIYEMVVEQQQPRPARTVASLDGAPLSVHEGAVRIPLRRDGAVHRVQVELGTDVGPRYNGRTKDLRA